MTKQRKFLHRYLEYKEIGDVRGMNRVKNNFERVFGYSLIIEEWEYDRENENNHSSMNVIPK